MIGRPFALSLTAGNVADVKAIPDLLPRLGGARCVIADKATTPTVYAASCATRASFP